MKKINYNRFFHLHTVSGIVISVGLYVIFFAGAFALFLEETDHWEKSPDTHEKSVLYSELNYDRLLDSLDQKYGLYGRNISFRLENGKIDHFDLSATKDTLVSSEKNESYELEIDPDTYKMVTHKEEPYSMGTLMYYLHFFYQGGQVGYYISGFVALFFLFAIVSGVIIHWKKIVPNFYQFRPLAKLKTIWTDAHTVLGMIGLPFQFIYALTGSMLVLSIVSAPALLLFDGDFERATEEMGFAQQDSLGVKTEKIYEVNSFINKVAPSWYTFTPGNITLENIGSTTMKLKASGNINAEHSNFLDTYKEVSYLLISGEKEPEKTESNYVKAIASGTYNLHYANYGDIGTWKNYLLKIIYFIMALITCFVIISGVLIWLEARNKNNVPEKQRRFNEKVGYWYLAISLSMFPVTALSYIVSKLLPTTADNYRETILNAVFFGGWLVLSIYFKLKKDNYFTNKYTLLSGGVLALCIPLISGFTSGNWIWKTFTAGQNNVFMIDVLWLMLSLTSLFVIVRLKQKVVDA